MSDETKGAIALSAIVGLFAIVIGWGLGGVMGDYRGRAIIRSQAIESGHAEWVVTGPDGETEFRWKECGQEESEVE